MRRRNALVCILAVGCGPRLIGDEGGAAMDESTATDAGDPEAGEAPQLDDGREPDPSDTDPSDPTGDGEWLDPQGDVELPNADVIAAAVYSDGTMVDFRVQFVEPPFAAPTTQSVDWCIDGSTSGTNSCADMADGIDVILSFHEVYQGMPGEFSSVTPGVDACEHGSFDAETNTLRILVPLALVDDDGELDWIVTSSFGGSGGANEWAPDSGLRPSIIVDELPSFSGTSTCF